MNLRQAIGVNCYDVDQSTGEKLSHRQKWGRVIDFLGGLDAVKPFVPFDISYLAKKITEDRNLNNTDMNRWDLASGFVCHKSECHPTFGGVWHLYREHGVNSASNSDGVCLLKEAARLLIERDYGIEVEEW